MTADWSRALPHRPYVLGVLTLVGTLNFIDRNLIILLLQPIKEDLHLSDTQLGFLTGIAFGLFYATLGVPMARWADRGNRVTLTSIAIGLWGATVMLCLFVRNFAQLVLARIAAGVGESGCLPPTYSLVGDYFPEAAERTRAMAIYWLANPLAALISFVAGGFLNAAYGWRATFFIMGLPALGVAILVKTTVKEPREEAMRDHLSGASRPTLMQVLRVLWGCSSTRHLGIAIVLFFLMAIGLAQWYGAFLMRSHGLATAEVGVWLGLGFGVAGAVGTLLGGYVAGRWFADNEAAQVRLSATSIALLVPCFALFLLLPHKYPALLALMPLVVTFNFFLGPTFALLQRLVSDEMRSTTLSVVMLLGNLIGMGLGPQLVGLLSDALEPSLGTDALRYAMLIMSWIALWVAYHFWQVGRTVQQDLSLAQSPESLVPGECWTLDSAAPDRRT
jgi:predicted MFS family arabinose efflux permease